MWVKDEDEKALPVAVTRPRLRGDRAIVAGTPSLCGVHLFISWPQKTTKSGNSGLPTEFRVYAEGG